VREQLVTGQGVPPIDTLMTSQAFRRFRPVIVTLEAYATVEIVGESTEYSKAQLPRHMAGSEFAYTRKTGKVSIVLKNSFGTAHQN